MIELKDTKLQAQGAKCTSHHLHDTCEEGGLLCWSLLENTLPWVRMARYVLEGRPTSRLY